MPAWPGSVGSRGSPGRRCASSAADAAPRSPVLCRRAAGPGRWARWPTISCWPRSAARSLRRRSSVRATRRSARGCASVASTPAASGCCASRARLACSAPTPQVRKRSKRLHEGANITVDASARIDRWAAADLLREMTTERFGSVEQAVAAGRALRYDGGPCFRSDHSQAEIDHLGIARSRPTTTSPRPTAASRSSSTRSTSRCYGSSASTPSNSYAAASATSRATTTSTGCSNATATAPRDRRATRSVTPR